ncbi:hypothetical protein [Scytonema sp. PRP1]|uniref:hypothetical protein n=1 Tax=Scytonema sp. PRP1 TaxID=3120513 RepID=UPI00300DAAC5
MNNLEFTLAVGICSILAGLLGSLSGLGGGVILVPMLTTKVLQEVFDMTRFTKRSRRSSKGKVSERSSQRWTDSQVEIVVSNLSEGVYK